MKAESENWEIMAELAFPARYLNDNAEKALPYRHA
jgi:hypothetical protein